MDPLELPKVSRYLLAVMVDKVKLRRRLAQPPHRDCL